MASSVITNIRIEAKPQQKPLRPCRCSVNKAPNAVISPEAIGVTDHRNYKIK
jgi:hypothetical protein